MELWHCLLLLRWLDKRPADNETMNEAQALGVKALAIQAGSASAEAMIGVVEQTVREWGGIDIPVNNAGIAVIDDCRLEDLDRTLAVNVSAVFVATPVAARHMPAAGYY